MPGQTYASDAWLGSFAKDANGFVDLSSYIPANACTISTAITPGHLATDFGSFNSAQNAAIANGSLCVLFRDGGSYAASVMNNNIDGATGTAAHPIIVSRIGATDLRIIRCRGRSFRAGGLGSPAPGNGKAWGGPIHYVIMDGLDFEGGATPPQGAAISFVDTNLGAPSDHILIEDCTVNGYQGGIDFESDDTAVASYSNNTFIIDGCTIANTRGGATEPGVYCNAIYDLLINRSFIIGCGFKNQLGTAHDVYVNANYTVVGDSQIRFINTVFGVGAACGCECNRGGFFDHCLSLANPTGIYGGGGAPAGIQYCVIDGGGGEFDTTNIKFASATGYPLSPGATLSLQPGLSGAGRGWGPYLDCASSGFIHDVYCINKNDAGDQQVNSGFAVGVHCTDPGKNGEGMPTAATIATIGPNVIVHNWFVYGGASNAINLSQTTPPLPTITYAGLVVLPGVTGVTGVSGAEPNYVDPNRTASSYAKMLGIAGVTDGPSLLAAMENQWSGSWDNRLTATAVVNWIQAGFAMGN